MEDCLQRKTSWDELLDWQDIFELDTEGKIGKEMYFYTVRHPVYNISYGFHSHILRCMVHGYLPQESINYIHKQMVMMGQKIHYRRHYKEDNIAQLFVDYLHMCDVMGVTPDKYPQNIKEAHDHLAATQSAVENKMTDMAIDKISTAAEKHLPKNEAYENSDYLIVMPHSSYDIIQEGQNMRNCVGSYLNRIADRETLVFFIRQKDKPKDSFITAEYRKGSITQLYYKNNRAVTEKHLKQIARDFAHNLKTASFEARRI